MTDRLRRRDGATEVVCVTHEDWDALYEGVAERYIDVGLAVVPLPDPNNADDPG